MESDVNNKHPLMTALMQQLVMTEMEKLAKSLGGIKDMNGLFFRAPYLALAMTAAIRKVLFENPKEFDPRKYLAPARTKVKELVRHKVKNVLCCAGHAFD